MIFKTEIISSSRYTVNHYKLSLFKIFSTWKKSSTKQSRTVANLERFLSMLVPKRFLTNQNNFFKSTSVFFLQKKIPRKMFSYFSLWFFNIKNICYHRNRKGSGLVSWFKNDFNAAKTLDDKIELFLWKLFFKSVAFHPQICNYIFQYLDRCLEKSCVKGCNVFGWLICVKRKHYSATHQWGCETTWVTKLCTK